MPPRAIKRSREEQPIQPEKYEGISDKKHIRRSSGLLEQAWLIMTFFATRAALHISANCQSFIPSRFCNSLPRQASRVFRARPCDDDKVFYVVNTASIPPPVFSLL